MVEAMCNWGILGPGIIARKFADAVQLTPGNRVVAAASNTPGKAADFAGGDAGIRPYDSYAALLEDPAVQAVYVSNVHHLHQEAVEMALAAGKPVLCEKPMGLGARQVRSMMNCARANGVFLMEAMWTRFLPVTKAVYDLLHQGAIGEVCMARGAFAFYADFNPASRLFMRETGGGGVLDLGVYLLAYLLTMMDGPPEAIQSMATMAASGVDDLCVADLRFSGGKLASIACGMRVAMPGEMTFFGTKGSVTVPKFWDAEHYELRQGDKTERVELPYANGFTYEVEAASRCIAQGLMECPEWPLASTLAVAEMMDTLRAQWGLVYPGE